MAAPAAPAKTASAPAKPAPSPKVEPARPANSAGAATGFGASATFSSGHASTQLNEINETVLSFVRSEGDAAMEHFRALSQVRSPSELFRLQVAEIQRSAGASFNCLTEIARSVGKIAGSTGGR